MAGQVTFFKKNKLDYTESGVVITATEAEDFVDYLRDRKNSTGLMTTDSVDADNTTLEADLGDAKDLTDILLLGHNFKSYTLKYWDEDASVWADFSPAIVETDCSSDNSRHSFTNQSAQRLQLVVLGTQVANSDKVLHQWIATELLGQLDGWPVIQGFEHDRNKRTTKMLSGKVSMVESVGATAFSLKVKNWKSAADLSIIETLYESYQGFLVWLSGGDESQFSSVRQGYRFEDLYLMRATNDYSPNWVNGMYWSGLAIEMKLAEVVD